MYCPDCGTELDPSIADVFELNHSEIELRLPCDMCGEVSVVTIAQEDLNQDQS